MINNWVPGTGTYEIKELSAQDSVLKELDIGTKYMECTSAGTIALPSDTAYGTFEFDLYRVTASETRIYFIHSKPRVIDNGYFFRISSTELIGFYRIDSGVSQFRNFTAVGYTTPNTWYRIKITRTLDGEFTVYIKGGSFGDEYVLVDVSGGSGTNPIIDTDYTISKYFMVAIGTGDRISNILIKEGVEQ